MKPTGCLPVSFLQQDLQQQQQQQQEEEEEEPAEPEIALKSHRAT
jgi:hypothetical protein